MIQELLTCERTAIAPTIARDLEFSISVTELVGLRVEVVPSLSSRRIHIWYTIAPPSQRDMDLGKMLLSADEHERARNIRSEHARRTFIIGRGLLRELLGNYVGAHPRDLQLEYSATGKPAVRGACGPGRIEFNVAHSGEIIMFAFARSRRIGVDVEQLHFDPSLEAVAKRLFSPAESAEWQRRPASERIGTFYRCWTREEAYLKATGEGLSTLSAGLKLCFGNARCCDIRSGCDNGKTTMWRITPLECIPRNYVGALAVEGLAAE